VTILRERELAHRLLDQGEAADAAARAREDLVRAMKQR
jgi:hypothetical protein